MKGNIHDFISKKNERILLDVDFHDLVELSEAGLSNEELSTELGIPKSYVIKLVNEMRKDF